MNKIDYKEFARQMRKNCAKDYNGNIVCSPELWEEIAKIIDGMNENEIYNQALEDFAKRLITYYGYIDNTSGASVGYFVEQIRREYRDEEIHMDRQRG